MRRTARVAAAEIVRVTTNRFPATRRGGEHLALGPLTGRGWRAYVRRSVKEDDMSALPAEDERALIRELAESALERAAPEELAVFDETAEEYFQAPEAVLNPKRRDEAVGFGLELALLTPSVLAAASAVVHFLLDVAADAVRDEAKASVAERLRRLVRHAGDAAPASLSPQQLRRVRDLAYERVRATGADEAQASLVADAIAGGLAVG
jgi:hypothetical protein